MTVAMPLPQPQPSEDNSFFTTKQGSLRVYNHTITDQVKKILLGEHHAMIIENLGANPLFVSSTNGSATQWVEAGETKSLDWFYDQIVWFSCGAGLTTDIRITIW